MFDIGFWEISLLALVGLMVLGPERLPAVARVVGGYLRKARRTWANVRTEIEAELSASEIREAVRKPMEEVREAMREPLDDLKDMHQATQEPIDVGPPVDNNDSTKPEPTPDTGTVADAVSKQSPDAKPS